MLAIRMRRVGSKKRPFFRLVVARSEAARDGSFLEILGHYYPRAKPARIEVDRDRVNYWVSKGARPSDTVRTLIARHLTAAASADTVAQAATASVAARATAVEPATADQADTAPAGAPHDAAGPTQAEPTQAEPTRAE